MLVAVSQGLTNQEIATALHMSVATTKTHVSRLLAKMGARERAQLVIAAYESGLVAPGVLDRHPGLVPARRRLRVASRVKGLARKSSMPASRQAFRSAGLALAVMATIRGRPSGHCSRMIRVAPGPSSSGMRMSMSTTS